MPPTLPPSPLPTRAPGGEKTCLGPWSFRYYMEPVGKCDDNFHLIDGPEGDQGSSILEGSFVFPGTHSEALVYARLIAAAPELYEALLELADMPASGLVHAAPWDKARAALAKASGK